MTEQQIQRKIIKWLEHNGYWVVKTIQCNKRGVPDILACSPLGEFIAIEVKTPEGKVSDLQHFQIEKINYIGGTAFVARSVEDVKHELGYDLAIQCVDTMRKKGFNWPEMICEQTEHLNETK